MNLSTLNTFQQVMLFFLIVIGSTILVSSAVLYVRKRAFESKFRGIAKSRKHGKSLRRKSTFNFSLSRLNSRLRSPEVSGAPEADLEGQLGDSGIRLSRPDEFAMSTPTTTGRKTDCSSSPLPSAEDHVSSPTNQSHEDDRIQWADDDQATISASSRARTRPHHRVFPMAGVGARPDLRNHPKNALPNSPLYEVKRPSALESPVKGSKKYFSLKGFISRNSQFYGLTQEERERLGGVEYKAVSFLSILVPVYFFMFHICGLVGLGSWLSVNRPNVARENGLSPFWVGAFFSASAFGNSGMALLDKNMTALQTRSSILYPTEIREDANE